MTNGEKLCIDFPDMHYTLSEKQPRRVVTTIGVCASFDLDWWNAEYKEPTTKNCESCRNFGSHHGICEICKDNKCWTEVEPTTRNCLGCKYSKDNHNAGTEECHLCMWENQYTPTTKNDLGVDCIDRVGLLKAMDTWDKFGYSTRYGLERLDKNDKGFVPYVKYEDMVECVKGMPSVTPQEPRWIPCSEKKPDKGGEYLLWGKIDESEEEDYCFIGDYYEFDEVFGTEISNYDPTTLGFLDTEIEKYYSVVAWMPLPLPWKGK